MNEREKRREHVVGVAAKRLGLEGEPWQVHELRRLYRRAQLDELVFLKRVVTARTEGGKDVPEAMDDAEGVKP